MDYEGFDCTNHSDVMMDVRRAASINLPYKQSRRPAKGNELAASEFRPLVPADRRVLFWTSPHSVSLHKQMLEQGIQPHLQAQIYEGLLGSTVDDTRESYGAGLLRYHQFCDAQTISEALRMPADKFLLSAFVASRIGTCSGKAIRNWLNGLRLWHIFNDAAWHGDEGWLPSLKKTADKKGAPFKRPPRGPITVEHLRALRARLDLSQPRDAAIWAAALAAFWGCRRLGDLLVRSVKKFSMEHDTVRSTAISRPVVDGRRTLNFHLRWTKTTGLVGGKCIFTATEGVDADLCPVEAFENHLAINHSPNADTPLFAYRVDSVSWATLTKDDFLRTTASIFLAALLENVFGHSYRIGGSLRLLLDGVEPEIIMKVGGWTSLCFLIYWRRLEQVIPLAITKPWDARMGCKNQIIRI
ncbi:hypothetical protein DFH06DRAFT_1227832 [Mycena polygramma]|nr:hypothetical protein DFH06DRAFT_1227832 [Mycena polygramma]